MKKYILAAVTLAAFTGMSFAQNAPVAAPAAAPAKMEKPAAKHEMKKVEKFNGEISAIDTVKNEITVKTEKGDKTVAVEAAKLAGLAQGQKVNVTVKDGKATVKAIVKHEGKHEGKKHDKKAEAPKAEAAPVAAPK
jgi:hypothetical protein